MEVTCGVGKVMMVEDGDDDEEEIMGLWIMGNGNLNPCLIRSNFGADGNY